MRHDSLNKSERFATLGRLGFTRTLRTCETVWLRLVNC